MRIGVVCEGPSDYPAVHHFVGAALREEGIEASFKSLHPDIDRTRPQGGWASVFSWFNKYPATARVQQFFNGGLFGGGLASEQLDALLVQIDSDILSDASFIAFVKKAFNITVASPKPPQARAQEVLKILSVAADLKALNQIDANRHVILPAVEATEAWCISIFSTQKTYANELTGAELTNSFMAVLEASESKKPEAAYSTIDKSPGRREKFCQKHGHAGKRVKRDCTAFSEAIEKLKSLS